MKRALVFALIFIPFFSAAQEDMPLLSAEVLASSRESELETEDEELVESRLPSKKFDLNTISETKLVSLPGINTKLAKNFFEYRKKLGNFGSVYELQCVPGWSSVVCRRLRSYFTVSDPSQSESLGKRAGEGSHTVSVQSFYSLQRSEGYRSKDSSGPDFAGSGVKLLLRYRYQNPGKMQWALMGEKDAGESMFGKGGKGFDHYSAYLMIQNWKKFETIVLGDYHINLGQGLVQWQSLAFNKSADVMQTMRQGAPVRPNRSANESGFYRGIAAEKKLGKLETVVFYSGMKRDGNLNRDSTGRTYISSLLNSGLHRTASELGDRKTVLQTTVGASAHLQIKGVKAGVNVVAHSFNVPVLKSDEPYNRYAFSGRRLLNESFDYAVPLGNIRIFGEAALSQPGSFAMIHGLLMSIANNTDITVLYRHLSTRFRSFESSAFTEAANPSGEKGVFSAIQVKVSPALSFSAFADHFISPFYKFRLHGAGRGHSYMMQIKIVPDKKSYCTFRFSMEEKDQNMDDAGAIHEVARVTRKSARIHAAYPLSGLASGSSRVEVAEITGGTAKQTGVLIYSEVTTKVFSHYSCAVRVQFTDIPHYSSRLYAYEATGATSGYVKMHYGSGFRLSARIKRKFSKKLTFWAALNHAMFTDENGMGTGSDRIDGYKRTSFSFQAIYNLSLFPR